MRFQKINKVFFGGGVMTDYNDIFEFEDESIRLDFKGAQYRRENHADLLKDIIAFANADFEDDRFIIIGIGKDEKNEKIFKGINKEEFVDPAVYQQLIRENIEPDVNFEYFLYPYLEKYYSIFRIYGCSDKPYLMKKEYGPLKQGDGWIRKGTHQPRFNRRDLDLITERKKTSHSFSGDLMCYFSYFDSDEITLSPLGNIKLPSDEAEENIRQIIKEKQDTITHKKMSDLSENERMNDFYKVITELSAPYGSYRIKSIDQLIEDLKTIKKVYCDDDKYALYEKHGHFINISILNQGNSYIEDASIAMIFPNIEGLNIAEKIFPKPRNRSSIDINATYLSPLLHIGYPHIKILDKLIIIRKNLGNIKHQIPINEVFEQPIRLVVQKNLAGQTIPVKCIIYGKNLPNPIERELRIVIG